MMNRPPVSELENMVGCRYLLVSAAARRARQIMHDNEHCGDNEAVVSAVNEIYDGKVLITHDTPTLGFASVSNQGQKSE